MTTAEEGNNNSLELARVELAGLSKKPLEDPVGIQELDGLKFFNNEGDLIACYVSYSGASALKFVDGRVFTGAEARFIIGEIENSKE